MNDLKSLENAVISPTAYSAPTGEVAATSFRLTSLHWALIGVAILCLLFIAFITIARSIQIETTVVDLQNPEQVIPQNANLEIHSWVQLPIGNRVLVLPGTHSIAVSAEGFESIQQDIQVSGERHQQIQVLLTRLPGTLDIQLDPAIAATVELDGELIGSLPGLITKVPAGKQSLLIDAPLYRTKRVELLVEGREITQPLSVELEAAWATVQVSTVPEGASVHLDEELVGVTPLELKVEEGTRQFEIRKENYKPHASEITVIAKQDIQIPMIELNKADGVLIVATTPAAAALIVNGKFRGITPMTLNVRADEAQTVSLYKAGYQVLRDEFVLTPNQQRSLDESLKKDLVSVKFSISPGDAKIYVDGVFRGTGSQSLSLSTMQHQISIRRPGYVDYQSQLIPTQRSRQLVTAKLLTNEQHFWANIPDTYVTQAGQKMKLFKEPGLVKMGSSRRESGRRSNEVQYEALLNKSFYVSKHEVTNKQFRQFKSSFSAGNYKRKSLDSNNHPAVNISWQDAAKYCNWLSLKEGLDPFYQTISGSISGNIANANGYRLLTEVEWSWLARTADGKQLIYPWGSEEIDKVNAAQGNYADFSSSDLIAFTIEGYDDGYKATSPVGRYAANSKGIFDIDGNVSEWVNDWYNARANLDLDLDELVDPLGPEIGEFHVIRGGSWAKGHIPQLRLAYRDYGATGKHDVGFRIARYVGSAK